MIKGAYFLGYYFYLLLKKGSKNDGLMHIHIRSTFLIVMMVAGGEDLIHLNWHIDTWPVIVWVVGSWTVNQSVLGGPPTRFRIRS